MRMNVVGTREHCRWTIGGIGCCFLLLGESYHITIIIDGVICSITDISEDISAGILVFCAIARGSKPNHID